ncbi:MAG: PH domain-containing protein [Syntrophomonadaceae bacterium]|jgi:hypothetical protein
MEYRAKPGIGVWLTILVVVAAFAIALWGIDYSLDPEDQVLKTMLLIPAYVFMGLFALLVIGAFNLSYKLGDKGLILRWGFYTKVVPWKAITNVIRVEGQSTLCPIIGADWPGYRVGIYLVKGIGPIRMYTTYPDDGFIFIKSEVGFSALLLLQKCMSGCCSISPKRRRKKSKLSIWMNYLRKLKGSRKKVILPINC